MNLINTSSGAPLTLTGTLKRSWSPNGYDHFLNLISSSYYVNSPIFRVIPGFIAQFGLNPDPKETEKYKRSIQDDPKGAGPGNKKVRAPNSTFYVTFHNPGYFTYNIPNPFPPPPPHLPPPSSP
jgi:cyclophilin family peptidyl-prolyl cis-trans isomerase